MSLYYEASEILAPDAGFLASRNQSLQSCIFNASNLKNKPVQIYALITEAAKWSSILSPIIETSDLLRLERKLNPVLSLLLVHDILLSKNGIAAPKNHILRQSVEKHKAHLSAAFTRSRLKAGAVSVEDWRTLIERASIASIEDESFGRSEASETQQPRWVRLNPLHGLSADDIEKDLFRGWTHVDEMSSLLEPPLQGASRDRYHCDRHISNLVATSPGTDLTSHTAYKNGRIILQDKASCFPAVLLDPKHENGNIIDACAAPGNKTSHLTALLAQSSATPSRHHGRPVVFAVERDPLRSKTLRTMLSKAGCLDIKKCPVEVRILANQDFLALNPLDPRFADVRSILLDPSCSGSGIIGRDDGDEAVSGTASREFKLVLPRRPSEVNKDAASKSANQLSKGKKRKRNVSQLQQVPQAPSYSPPTIPTPATGPSLTTIPIHPNPHDPSAVQPHDRLRKLSTFQHKLLLHAFRFPAASRIVYSTCSVHAEENEQVVVRALASDRNRIQAKTPTAEGGWRIMRRSEQPAPMQAWTSRGDFAAVRGALEHFDGDMRGKSEVDADAIADACIRCNKGDGQGTMGFFVVGFVRDVEAERAREASGSGSEGSGGQDDHGFENGDGCEGGAMGLDEEDAASEGDWEGFED